MPEDQRPPADPAAPRLPSPPPGPPEPDHRAGWRTTPPDWRPRDRTTAVTAPVRPPHPPPTRRPLPLGRLVLAALLIAGGVLWLLGVLDVARISARTVLSIALIVVGAGLVVGAWTGSRGGLFTLGVVLTVALTALSAFNIRVEGGAGSRTIRPSSASALQDRYRLGAGNLTVDLRDVSLPPGTTTVEVGVGLGQAVVVIPSDVPVRVHATAGTGQVVLFGRERNGFDIDETVTRGDFRAARTRLVLEVSVGLGQVEVRT